MENVVSAESRRAQYKKFGGVLFEGLLTKEEIAELRSACEGYFSFGATHMGTKDFLGIPALAGLPFNRKVVEAVRSVLGNNYATLNQFAAAANLHNPQWHRDSGNQGDLAYLFDSDYQIAKCGVYLQDNDPEWGGGLEVIPGSHRPGFLGNRSLLSRSNLKNPMSRIQRWALDARNKRLPHVWLPIKAGDVFLFHANLFHRASQPLPPFPDKKRGGYKDVQFVDPPPPKSKYKYLLDWEVSPMNRYLPVYLEHQASRAKTNPNQKLFVESLDSRYPQDYPKWLIDQIKELDVHVVNYTDDLSENPEQLTPNTP